MAISPTDDQTFQGLLHAVDQARKDVEALGTAGPLGKAAEQRYFKGLGDVIRFVCPDVDLEVVTGAQPMIRGPLAGAKLQQLFDTSGAVGEVLGKSWATFIADRRADRKQHLQGVLTCTYIPPPASSLLPPSMKMQLEQQQQHLNQLQQHQQQQLQHQEQFQHQQQQLTACTSRAGEYCLWAEEGGDSWWGGEGAE